MVAEFHEKFSLQRPGKFDFENLNKELRKNLINEEAKEFSDALDANDPIAAIDALCDLLYVTYGAAVSMGVDLDPYFYEVHRSNMAKLDPLTGKPIYREDGKLLKPSNWTPPDLVRVHAMQERFYEVYSEHHKGR